ncbi:MAG: type IV secretory system conjugative DNA transfer family protein, partial [Clostridia bacterium]|nr:type IV secretory system conjugative DNA transfer family protein [Clostridia bacterium]
MTGLKSQLLREHIEQNYPDAKLIRYDDPESDLSFYDSEGLGKVEGSWFPLSCYRDMKTGKLIVGGSRGIYHTYIEGETGVGKTTRFCMQSIRALSSTKQKPSFVVTDMHGEIIENLYLHLIKNGYAIRIINCDNPERSDTYNPLACIGEEAQREKTLTYNVVQGVRHMASLMQPVESRQDPIWDQGACAY